MKVEAQKKEKDVKSLSSNYVQFLEDRVKESTEQSRRFLEKY